MLKFQSKKEKEKGLIWSQRLCLCFPLSALCFCGSFLSRYDFLCKLVAAFFELTNHLGNVHMTLSDYRRAVDQGQSVAYFSQVASASEYYPFGMLLTQGNYSSGSYRFGFNGMEKDDEFKGTGNSYDFGARMYDPRIGKWLSVDPLFDKFPYQGPYISMDNNPIAIIDPTGMGGELTQGEGKSFNLTVNMNLYSDANSDFSQEEMKQILTTRFGEPDENGQWTISRENLVAIKYVNTKNKLDDAYLNIYVKISIIPYNEAQEKITTETNSANHYYYMSKQDPDNGSKGGSNLRGTNQGVIFFREDMTKLGLDHTLFHEPGHSIFAYRGAYGEHNEYQPWSTMSGFYPTEQNEREFTTRDLQRIGAINIGDYKKPKFREKELNDTGSIILGNKEVCNVFYGSKLPELIDKLNEKK